jgi:hypothetical protein
MSAIDATPRQGSEGFDPGPNADDWWGPVAGPLHTEGPNPLADLFGSTPGGGTALMDGVQPHSFGTAAGGTVRSTNPFSWLVD